MVINLAQPRQIVTIWILVSVPLIAVATVGGGSDTKSGVVVVVTDGVDPVTGSCNNGQDNSSRDYDNVRIQDTKQLLRGFAFLLNTVTMESFNGSSILVLVEASCNDTTDLILHEVLDIKATRPVTGVITITRGHTAREILEVLRHFNIPVLEIVSGDIITSTSLGAFHYIIPHYTYWQIQSVLFAATVNNWTALTVAELGQEFGIFHVFRDLFMRLAFEKGICSLPTITRSNVPVVVFQTGNTVNLTFGYTEARTVVFIGEPNIKSIPMENIMSVGKQFVLYLESMSTEWSRLEEAIKNACNSSSINSDPFPEAQGPYQNICLKLTTLNVTSFGIKSYLDNLLRAVTFLLNMSGIPLHAPSCNISNASLACMLVENNQTVLDENSQFLYKITNVFEMQYISHNNDSLSGDFVSMPEGRFTLRVPSNMSSAILNKDCGHVCNKCVHCFPSTISETKIMTSRNGDAFIIGFFPIHQSSQKGFCDQPNLRGYSAAVAFLEAINSYTPSWNMFTIMGVVFDSCSSSDEIISTIHSIETCSFYFKEEVNHSHIRRSFDQSSIVGYVYGMSSFDLPTITRDRVVLSLQEFGYSIDADLKRTFINNILMSLSKIGWTVVNVIITDQEPFKTMAKLLSSSPLSNYFCFVNEIAIRSDPTHRSYDLDKTARALEKTPAYLLLTNREDTLLVIQRIQKHAEESATKVSFILSPWNWDIIELNNVSTFVNIVIRFRPLLKDAFQESSNSISSRLYSIQTPWSQEFQNFTSPASHIDLALILQGTSEFLASFETNLSGGFGSSVRSTGLDMTATYVTKNIEKQIAFVDKVLIQKEPFDGPSYNVCRGWCPVCYKCTVKDIPQQANLYLEGDIQITGMFPLHYAGMEAFTCGAVQNDTLKLLEIQAFMFAVESIKSRYPYLLPGLNVGGLILDTCSNSVTAMNILGNFQTCALNFASSETYNAEGISTANFKPQLNNTFTNPTKNMAYVIDAGDNNTDYISRAMQISKLQNVVFVNSDGRFSTSSTGTEDNTQFPNIIVQILTALGWNTILIISENLSEFQRETNILLKEAHENNICVLTAMSFEAVEFLRSSSSLEQYRGMPVVMLSSKEASQVVFDSLNMIKNSYFWIIPVYHETWGEFMSIADYFPLGSIIIDVKSKQNNQFNSFIHNLTVHSGLIPNMSLWFQDFWRLRFSCSFSTDNVHATDAKNECPFTAPVTDIDSMSSLVYDVIKSVDAILHAVHAEYTDRCPQKSGICDVLAEDITERRLSFIPDVRFQYQGEQLDYKFDGDPISTLSIFNYQKDGFVEIGSYFKSALTLNATKIRLYTAEGLELNQIPHVICMTDCHCLDAPSGNDTDLEKKNAHLFSTTRVEFSDELWAIIVVVISGLGALVSLIFAGYVLYKVSRRALAKRYVGLGLTLLFSLTLLYLTVLPFVLSPNKVVCCLRYMLPGLAYTLCFAIILVKLMSLQNYKLIGLGGEVSGLNQFLTTFFIVSVQIAIGVEWWHHDATTHTSSNMSSAVGYICNFSRQDFAAYHAYVVLLILICCFYSLGVRKEKKNRGEAKLLLSCSWTCLAFWAIWLPCFFLLDRKWSDVIICAAILACATAALLIIFVPKIRMVSRLKYDLSQKANVRNGHSVDTDFLYERPYSLPGTLTSTFSSGKMNYPKTFSNFDADVNY